MELWLWKMEDVNVHEYDSVARKVMRKMIGQPAFTFFLIRKDKAKHSEKPQLLRLLQVEPLILHFYFNVTWLSPKPKTYH